MNTLEKIGIIPLDFGVISRIIGNYKSPRDKISRMEKAGEIIRLKKGMFVVSPKISKSQLSKELIANHLLGPSYISLETALSYYGMIPERVYSTRSVTIKRSKRFSSPVGDYEFLSVPEDYYSIGIKIQIINEDYAFLIASPEKAICDLVLTTPNMRIQSEKAMLSYLNEILRIDASMYPEWDLDIIEDCIKYNRKKREFSLLHNVLKNG